MVVFSVSVDIGFEPFAEGIDDADADSMETSGDFVTVTVELASGMEGGKDDLERASFCFFVLFDGNTSAVVFDRATAIGVDVDEDGVAISGQRFIDGVVEDLVDEMMEAAASAVSDIHIGSFSDGLYAAENLDVAGIVSVIFHVFLVLRSVYDELYSVDSRLGTAFPQLLEEAGTA
jgi:hypothetical protein